MNNYLTPERVKSMPISMRIIKAIKEKYGIPTRAFADTIHGIECSAIYVEGLPCTNKDIDTLIKPFKTESMLTDDWETECDSCSVILIKSNQFKSVKTLITSLFEEV